MADVDRRSGEASGSVPASAGGRELGAGHVLGGRYVLERPLAAGGMGQVWIARHDALDRLVAVKLMAKEAHASEVLRHRFEREAKACAQLRSPHVVQVFDYGHEAGFPYLVMELLEGDDLSTLLTERQRWSPPEVADAIGQAARGLHEAHQLGIIHRDIKLSNLFMASAAGQTTLKVLDFGVARVAEPSQRNVTAVDARLGTTSYMSPEQLVTHDVDARADVWSLAVVAFRLLTGASPFAGETPMQVAQHIALFERRRVRDVAPDLSPCFDEVFDRAFARPIAERFQNVGDLASAIARGVASDVAGASSAATPASGSAPAWAPAPPRSNPTFPPPAMARSSASGAPHPTSHVAHSVAPATSPTSSLGGAALDATEAAPRAAAATGPWQPLPLPVADEPTTVRSPDAAGLARTARPKSNAWLPWSIAIIVATVLVGVLIVVRGAGSARSDATTSPDASPAAPAAEPPHIRLTPSTPPAPSNASAPSSASAPASAPSVEPPDAPPPTPSASASAPAHAPAARPVTQRTWPTSPREPPREPARDILDGPR